MTVVTLLTTITVSETATETGIERYAVEATALTISETMVMLTSTAGATNINTWGVTSMETTMALLAEVLHLVGAHQQFSQ